MIVGLKEAKASGLKRYFTGVPCKNGHVAERIVRNRACIECERARHAVWREANSDWWHQRYLENIDAAAEYGRQYRENSSEKRKATCARYRSENIEKVRKANTAWSNANLEKRAVIQRNRRSRTRSAEGHHTTADIKQILIEQRGQCNACTADLYVTCYDVDHIIPLNNGGSNDPRNLQLLCGPCNYSKGTKEWSAWLEQNKSAIDKKRAYWTEWRSARDAAF